MAYHLEAQVLLAVSARKLQEEPEPADHRACCRRRGRIRRRKRLLRYVCASGVPPEQEPEHASRSNGEREGRAEGGLSPTKGRSSGEKNKMQTKGPE